MIELSLGSNSRNQPHPRKHSFLDFSASPESKAPSIANERGSAQARIGALPVLRLRSFLANFDLARIDIQSREIAAPHHDHSQCPACLFPYMSVFIFHGIGQCLRGSLVPF